MTYGVHLIAAVGLSGQIGLGGKVPWHGDEKYAELTARNNEQFLSMTEGGVLIMGSVTAQGLPDGFKLKGREVIVWNRHRMGAGDIASALADIRRSYPTRDIWICGGGKVYELFIPFVDWHHISVMPYDGPGDTWLPPIIPAWSTLSAEDFKPFSHHNPHGGY